MYSFIVIVLLSFELQTACERGAKLHDEFECDVVQDVAIKRINCTNE